MSVGLLAPEPRAERMLFRRLVLRLLYALVCGGLALLVSQQRLQRAHLRVRVVVGVCKVLFRRC